MSSLFEIVTSHDTTLACDPASQAVVCARQVGAPLIRLVASISGSSKLAIFSSDDADGFPVRLPQFPPKCPLQMARVVELRGDRIAFINPANLGYLSAPPQVRDESFTALLTTDRLAAWETFQFRQVSAGSVHPLVRQRIRSAERLLGEPLSADRLARFLDEHGPVAAAMNACVPLVSTAELDLLSERLRDDATLLAAFSAVFPGDLWASRALPDLAAWCSGLKNGPAVEKSARGGRGRATGWLLRARAGRKTSPSVALPNQAPQPKRVIGPEFDVLASHEGCRQFLTLPHACSVRARRSVRPERTLAMIVAARNEGVYLLEWLAYHRLLGVEDFFIYSNDNEDGSNALLAALADSGVITWIDNRVERGAAQFKAFGHALGFMPDLLAFRWTLMIDLDEFLVLDRSRHADAIAFCDWHSERTADAVAINWQFFAPEAHGDVLSDPVTARNRRVLSAAQMGEGVRLVKSMSRPNRVMHSEAHVPFADPRSTLVTLRANGEVHSWHNSPPGQPHSPKFADKVMTGGAVVNHYIYKSPGEWLWKRTRNPGDQSVVQANVAKLITDQSARALLSHLNARNLQVDDRAFRSAPDLLGEIAKLSRLAGVAAATADVQTRYMTRMASIRETYRRAAETQTWSVDAREFLGMAGC